MPKAQHTYRSNVAQRPPILTAKQRLEAETEHKEELAKLAKLYMPLDRRVLSMMNGDWLLEQLKDANLRVTGLGCWQHKSDTLKNVVNSSLQLKVVRRRTKNLGSLRLPAESLLPEFQRFAGYLWREVHLAFNANTSLHDDFVTLEVKSLAAQRSKSASIYCQQLAAWVEPADARQRLVARTLNYECSHLCNNPLCYNPDHLFLESPAQNQARESCRQAETVGTEAGDAVACTHGGGGVPYCVRSKITVKVRLIHEGAGQALGSSAQGERKFRKATVFRKRRE